VRFGLTRLRTGFALLAIGGFLLAIGSCRAGRPDPAPGDQVAAPVDVPPDSTVEPSADSLTALREDSIARNPEIALEHNGRIRRAFVHLPEGWGTATALPVVLAFHGGGGSASGFRDYVALDVVADTTGFIVVYPDGTGPLGRRLLTWNAGDCCGYASDEDVDDIGFVLRLLDELGDTWPIDPGRVYATGLSNGAMFTYRLAAEIPARFAAIAPVAGAGTARPKDGGLPVPVIHFHSIDDPRALYDGGLGPPFPLTNRRVEHVAVETVIQRWATHDGCRSSPEMRVRIQPMEDQASAKQGATRIAYRACDRGSEVILWRLSGAGHVWPGARTLAIQRLLGPPFGFVNANDEMWAFFQAHRRGRPAKNLGPSVPEGQDQPADGGEEQDGAGDE